jgi:hypothetical protein
MISAKFEVKPVNLAGSGRLVYAAVALNVIPWPVRYAFLLFIFTLPFEAQDLGVLSGSLSPARIAGMLFFAIYFIYHNPLAKRHFPGMPMAVRWFLVYVTVYAIGGILQDGLSGIMTRLITMIQLFIFLWIGSDLLKDDRLATKVLVTYAMAMVTLAVAMLFGFGGVSHEVVAGRTTVFKEDVNGLATSMFGTIL